MRTIKFRGKRLDGQGWVYGDLIRHYENQRRFIALDQMAYTYTENGISRLVSERYHEVLPESVGQWTGLVDRHGKEIFEGDVVFYDNRMKLEVKYDNRTAQFTTDEYWLWSIVDYSEVIGNIHDNPELMEVEQ